MYGERRRPADLKRRAPGAPNSVMKSVIGQVILEINPLPGLSPSSGDLVVGAQAGGTSHAELANLIVEHALEQYDTK